MLTKNAGGLKIIKPKTLKIYFLKIFQIHCNVFYANSFFLKEKNWREKLTFSQNISTVDSLNFILKFSL